jgi:hypothetical protein
LWQFSAQKRFEAGGGATNWPENRILFSSNREWPFLLMDVSGIPVHSIAECRQVIKATGTQRSIETEGVISTSRVSCSAMGGAWFAFGSMN